jgi:hypothetical protein
MLAKAVAFLDREQPKTPLQRLEWELLRWKAEDVIRPK